MTNLDQAIAYAHEQKNSFLRTLEEFVSIPSVSTKPENKNDIQATAQWIENRLHAIGITQTEIFPTPGNPIVYAEKESPASNAPTVLIYGHYDVQPAEPLELWQTPAFSPTIRGENLFARGASDMKGQVAASLFAVESLLQAGDLPVNIKFILEGEEEIGSPNLVPFIREHKDLLKCDVCLNPDTGMIAADIPTITYALRGLAYFELRVYGPKQDLHSGVFGGAVHNPAIVLSELIAGMHDGNGHITLPGFYDRVLPLSDEERTELSRLPMDDSFYMKQTGVPAVYGEAGYTSVERTGARPSLDVNGIYSGFIDEGSKTIIPAWAMAKISMRLVARQRPDEVYAGLKQYLEEHAPNTVRWELTQLGSGSASISDIHHPATQALTAAMTEVFGKAPVYKREGGSVPIVADMQEILGIDSILTGFGLADDNIHSPNEKLHLPTWYRGIDTLIAFFYYYAESQQIN